jgi:hypothetical protein
MNILFSLRNLSEDQVRVNYGDPNLIWESISMENRARLSEEDTKIKIELYNCCAEILKNLWPSLLDSLPKQFDVPLVPSDQETLEERFEFLVDKARAWFYGFDSILLNSETDKHPETYKRIQELTGMGAGEVNFILPGRVIQAGFTAAFESIEHSFTDPILLFLCKQPRGFNLNSEQIVDLIDCMRKVSSIPHFLAMRHFERSLELQNRRDGYHVPWLNLSLNESGWELSINENILVAHDLKRDRILKTPTLGCPFHHVPRGLSEFNTWVYETVIVPCIRGLLIK